MAFGKSPFLTGFGLGFLAFGLKKLLLPFFIGAQIVKSVLVALFLPTLLGHIGKLVGKGLTSVATQSGSSGSQDQVAEFDFKDPGGGYGDAETAGSDSMSTWTVPGQSPVPSNAHATLAALNPGRTPGVSQTAQDRPLDHLSGYLKNYANYAMALSQGYHRNPFANNQVMYSYYEDNISSNNYRNEVDNNDQMTDMDHVANEINNSNFLDLITSETQQNSNHIDTKSHTGSADPKYSQKFGDYHGNSYRSQQKSKYVKMMNMSPRDLTFGKIRYQISSVWQQMAQS